MRINVKLKLKIIEKYRSQADLAAQARVSEPRISRILWQRVAPTEREIKLICRALQCEPDEVGLHKNNIENRG